MIGKKRETLLRLAGLGILVVQAVLTYGLAREEFLPSADPLAQIPRRIGEWGKGWDQPIEAEVLDILGPDDVLSRTYHGSQVWNRVHLFVSYYLTQHRARNAHDPKICLPGAGWEPQISEVIHVAVPGEEAVEANYYVIKKGPAQAVVVYWFQTHERAVAAEQSLRWNRFLTTVAQRRSDMALVRIVVPVVEGDLAGAKSRAVEFAEAAHPFIERQFPPTPKG